jgi:hypothetical protein
MRYAGPYDSWLIYLIITSTIVVFWVMIQKEKNRQKQKAQNLCPVCGYDLRASGEYCPECGSPIVADYSIEEHDLNLSALTNDWPSAPIQPRGITFGEPTLPLFETGNSIAANLLAQQLIARGVPAAVTQKQHFQQVGYLSQSRPSFKVLVPQADLESARQILAHFRKPTVSQ